MSSDGWAEAIDPKTGRTYYYNAKLNLSTWDRPKEMGMLSQTLPPQKLHSAKIDLGRTSHGDFKFVSSSLDSTAPISALAAIPGAKKKPEWHKLYDSTSGRYVFIYYLIILLICFKVLCKS
jgi:hypothetical protein